jgi:hypothetical protein
MTDAQCTIQMSCVRWFLQDYVGIARRGNWIEKRCRHMFELERNDLIKLCLILGEAQRPSI